MFPPSRYLIGVEQNHVQYKPVLTVCKRMLLTMAAGAAHARRPVRYCKKRGSWRFLAQARNLIRDGHNLEFWKKGNRTTDLV